MPLRQLLAHSEKCTRDLHDHVLAELAPCLADFRRLSVPVRKRSGFPKMLTISNVLSKVDKADTQMRQMADYLQKRLEEIRKHALADQKRREL
jgi:hypothetical protein